MGTHPIFESDYDCLTVMKLILGLVNVALSDYANIQSPLAEWNEEATKSGPTVHVQIPTAIQQAGRQFNKLEMAKRMAAAPIPVDNVNFENQEQMTDALPDVRRYVHLDLSAAPPSRAYLIELIKLLGSNGIGG